MKVVWSRQAYTQLDGIYRYIEADTPLYARQVADKLTRRSDQLAATPNLAASCLSFRTRHCAN